MTLLETFVSTKQRGASLFEFVISMTVIGVLTGVLLSRLWYYQREAELAGVHMTVENIQRALEIRVVQAKLPDRSVDLTFLTEENPFYLLKVTPGNYVGELYSPGNGDIGAGNWCFDRTNKTAVYLLNYGNSFEDSQTKLLKFKVKLQGLPQSPAKPSGAPESLGVAFEQVKD